MNHILVVEDSETSGILIRSLFEDSPDISIKITKNGKDAFKYLKTTVPNLILLDIMLPDIDGFTILEKLKSDNTTQNIPVVMVSANDRPDDIKKAIKLGALDYITKPIGINKLYDRVNSIFNANL